MDVPSHVIREQFEQHDRKSIIENFKVASILGMILVPSFAPLDLIVYGADTLLDHAPRLSVDEAVALAPELILVRFICSALIAVFLWVLLTGFGRRFYRVFAVTLVLLPGSAISYMVYRSPDGLASPYYAGLNLVLLMTGFVLRWSFWDSIIAVLLVWAEYSLACFLNAQNTLGLEDLSVPLSVPVYFMGATGIIVITGNYFFSKARFREFELSYRLRHKQAELEESNRKLLEMDQIKSRFFANISHELRTPLTLLLAPLESLLQQFGPSADQEMRHLLTTMHSSGMRLLKLINDLLELVRLESGRLEIKREPVPVADFIKGLVSAARQVADDKRLELETWVAPEIDSMLADRDKLEKILMNLIFNALKFTPTGGRVEVRAELRDAELVLIVSDTGIGIADKNLPFIFDRFWQADGSSKRKFQGVGIGLAIVKELTELQGGRITVTSKEGKGTRFELIFPYEPAEPGPRVATDPPGLPAGGHPETDGTVSSEAWLANLYRRAELFPTLTSAQNATLPVETEAPGQKRTVLIADDETDMLRFLRSQLSSTCRVLEAVDGQQAIDKAAQSLPDLILLDMMMPEKDGLQACCEIRERSSTQSIPIIMLTARADEETKMAALSAGANDFLAKPFSTTELHVRIRNLLEAHNYQRKLSRQNQQLESTIEQLKETETQLVQNEKLASLGRMSAGIIHEINNPLNFAATGVYTLRNKCRNLEPEQQRKFEEILADVDEGLKRVKTIVADLRTFTRLDKDSLEQVDVADAVAAALRLVSSEIKKHNISVTQSLAPGQTVWANKNKLIQVLVNLLQNSVDAMETKGYENEVPAIHIDGLCDRGKSIVRVRDNGPGIDSTHRDKIFEPFFTTKDIGKGLGLGLSICYRLVQEFDGTISVRTEPGKFCEFGLEFPAKG